MEKEEIKVSINCITYNQKSYIRKTIESFLMQKTNFNYEILIHDDASTDGTSDIIKEYERKYPHIIKAIYQTENQYSKGIRVEHEFNFKRAKGKYIAICEGDDYWTDENKLQKQVDYMEKNPLCTLCVHTVDLLDDHTNKITGSIKPYNESKKCYAEDFIVGGGDFVGTNSILFPKKVFENAPQWYLDSPVGDYPLQVFLASKGYAFFMEESMSVYRVNAKNSWNQRMTIEGEKKAIQFRNRIINLLNEINIYTDRRYEKEIKEAKRINRFEIAVLKEDFKELKQDEFSDLYKKLSKVKIIKLFLKRYCPFVNKLVVYRRAKRANE